MVYMVILLCYDYTGGGFRYLLPVLPFGLVYFAVALLFFIKHAGISKKVFVVCSIALVLIAYNYDWQKIYKERKHVIEGPMQRESKELIQHICEGTMPDDRLIFIKPRALALFTGRTFFCTHPDERTDIIFEQIKQQHISYIITFEKIPNKGILNFIESNPTNVELTWKNDLFKFYKIKL